jgi:prepilin-type N-terminal cleavage/methylation domain-containing protein
MPKRSPKQSSQLCRSNGFTLIELLVVIAIIAILASLLIPVLNAAKQKSYAATCVDNNKQLMLCWIMYADDNDDFIVDGNVGSGCWTGKPTMDIAGLKSYDQAYQSYAQGWENGLFYKYANSPDVMHCPSDPRARGGVPYTTLNNNGNAVQVYWSWMSYSIESGANAGGYSQDTNPGAHKTNPTPPAWTCWKKGDAQDASDQWVFTEEQDSRDNSNEGGFELVNPGCPLSGVGYQDLGEDAPACCAHIDSSIFGFADGHAAKHKYSSILYGTFARDNYPDELSFPGADVQWLDMWSMFNWDTYRSQNTCQ